MKQLLTLAACVAILSGCDFVGGSGETVAFSNLTLISTPLPVEADGTGPDLYVEIQDASGRAVVKADRVIEDADASDLPFVISTNGELIGNARTYFVVVMDRNADGYEYIAASTGFSPDQLRASSEPVFEITSEAGDLRAELTLAP